MFGFRGATILVLNLALAGFTFGCSSDGGGDSNGGTGGDGIGGMGGGGAGGDAGAGGGGTGGIGGEIAANFETSLHNTRVGKDFWYRLENNGMELLTGVDYEDFVCKDCHAAADTEWDGPGCDNCHDSGGMGGAGGGGGMALPKHLDSATCLGCHGRQNAEAGRIQDRDFHKLAGASCVTCHGDRNPDPAIVDANDVHGNGTPYDTMLRPGAIAARCNDCHTDGGSAPVPTSSGYHSAAHGAIDCALCHTETVLSCINCHLEEDLDREQKCASAQIFNWKFVMKWDKEGEGDEVYHPATLMTLKYDCSRPQTDPPYPACPPHEDGPERTFAVFAPYYAHTVTEQAMMNITETPAVEGAPFPGNTAGCAYCHSTANCDTIVNAGQGMNPKQKLVAFDGSKLGNPISGLIPLPEDYADRFEIDFVAWAEGSGTGCQPQPQNLVLFETGPDLWQTGANTTEGDAREVGAPLNETEFGKFCPTP